MSLPDLRRASHQPAETMTSQHSSAMFHQQPISFARNQPVSLIQSWPTSSTHGPRPPPTPTKEPQDLFSDCSPSPIAIMDPKISNLVSSNLMSPPEAELFDSFKHHDLTASLEQSGPAGKKSTQGLTPPTSPPNHAADNGSTALPSAFSIGAASIDPPLYPMATPTASAIGATGNTGAASIDLPLYPPASPPQAPLFNSTAASREPTKRTVDTMQVAAAENAERVVDAHIASRPASLFREATPPQREDYELALYFRSNLFKLYQENPRAYIRKERELLRADRKHVSVSRPMIKLPPILPASRPTAPKPQLAKIATGRIQKPAKVKTGNNPRPIRATPTAVRQTIRVSSTPTPEPRVRTVAPNREDKDFDSLPDYCPPLSTLPNKPNSLKVDWKGNALDLSKDPHAHLLHPDEVMLAAGLRLDCATYLTSKRRIFMRRLHCAEIGKEFRKTDAQQACKIDVNKASKLWTAYDKVGWLELKWMQKHLARAA